MALQLTENYKGFEANYWKIIGSRINFNGTHARIEVALYKDKETRDADPLNYVKKENYVLGGLFLSSATDIRADMYVALKDLVTNDEGESSVKKFEDAIDV